VQIALGDVMFVGLKPVVVARQENALALATCFRLNNKCLCFSFIKLLFEALDVSGKHPRFWKELELFGKVLLHRKQIFGKQVLPRHSKHSWKVVGSLIRLHFCQQRRNNRPIYEPDVPVLFIVLTGAQATLLRHLMYDFVLSIVYIYNQRLSVSLVILLRCGQEFLRCMRFLLVLV